ncbi:MAG: hypothetical protein FJ087_12405, partial [Deltaproteobacteria bacterium]|nr:hypothetical protein [Deltaproteobacteria bacterium]
MFSGFNRRGCLVARFTTLFMPVLALAYLSCGGGSSSPCSVPDTGLPGQPDATADAAEVPGEDALAPDADDPGVEGAEDPGGADWGWIDGYEAGPGQFLGPCTSNDDCETGYCVEGPSGYICTKGCLAGSDCPPDFACVGVVNTYPDVTYICLPRYSSVCRPCSTDTQCSGGVCVGGRCTVPCSAQVPCPEPYLCKAIEGQEGQFCVPPSGACECLEKDAGVKRTCSATDPAIGTCYGYETCDPAAGFVGCDALAPAEETCNGIDDDCDGTPDDGLPADRPCERENADGICKGIDVCLGPKGWSCSAPEPAAESCDGIDNDCNGTADDPFKVGDRYAVMEHCGGCGMSCVGLFPNATIACDADKEVPRCVVTACAEGYTKLNDYQCVPLGSTLCTACVADADCMIPGALCVALPEGRFCGRACGNDGDCPEGYSCQAAGGGPAQQCVPTSGTCSCSAANPGVQKGCEVTWTPSDPGAPTYTCRGTQTCEAAGWGACALAAETCDGQDDDCNGQTDEGFRDPGTGKYVANEHCGVCNNNCTVMPVTNGHGECDAAKTVPDCKLVCNDPWHDVDGNPKNGCECHKDGDADMAGDGKDADCDGIDGEVDAGVFVAKWGSDANPGSIDLPRLTIQSAIDLAATGPQRDVYVATGVYTEPVVLKAGVGVFGGYSADFRVREPVSYETVVLGGAPTGQARGAVNATGIKGGAPGSAVFAGFVVFGYSQKAPGASSYAVWVRDCDASLAIRDCRIVGGEGGDGLSGTPGAVGEDGVAGVAGGKAYDSGVATCSSAQHNAGGAGGTKSCGTTPVSGGSGGTAVCPDFDENDPPDCPDSVSQTVQPVEVGKPGSNNPGGVGGGGAAGRDSLITWKRLEPFGPIYVCQQSNDYCTEALIPPESMVGADGQNGRTGDSGAAGAGCAGGGEVAAGEWKVSTAGNGQAGTHGGGGGGGGAAGGVEVSGCNSQAGRSDVGGSGGGGGSGGCGATGGSGGGGGGGSFAVFLAFGAAPASLPEVTGCTIQPGRGGDGGNGGSGGVGGK